MGRLRQDRRFRPGLLGILGAALLASCSRAEPAVVVLGRDAPGIVAPRALAARDGRLYVLDGAGALIALDYEGRETGRRVLVRTARGFPAGVTVQPDGRLLVADAHESRVLRLPAGPGDAEILCGGYGIGAGEFVYPQRIALREGDVYVSEYGFPENSRVQVFGPDGRFLRAFGAHGDTGGAFLRPSGLAFGPDGLLYVADASHRVLRWTSSGEYRGDLAGPDRLSYPTGLAATAGALYVVEYGNNRISRFGYDGTFLGACADFGPGVGALSHPRDVAVADGFLFVADTGNDRVLRARLTALPWGGGT